MYGAMYINFRLLFRLCGQTIHTAVTFQDGAVVLWCFQVMPVTFLRDLISNTNKIQVEQKRLPEKFSYIFHIY